MSDGGVFAATVRDDVCQLRRPDTRWLSSGWNGGESTGSVAYNVTVPEGWPETDLDAYVASRRADAGFERHVEGHVESVLDPLGHAPGALDPVGLEAIQFHPERRRLRDAVAQQIDPPRRRLHLQFDPADHRHAVPRRHRGV